MIEKISPKRANPQNKNGIKQKTSVRIPNTRPAVAAPVLLLPAVCKQAAGKQPGPAVPAADKRAADKQVAGKRVADIQAVPEQAVEPVQVLRLAVLQFVEPVPELLERPAAEQTEQLLRACRSWSKKPDRRE